MKYTGPNQYDIIRFGKNTPYKAWSNKNVKAQDKDKYVCFGKPRTLFSGRFVAVSGFIYAIVNGKYSVLANLRGSGTPDYQGYWNCPCGYLECYENSKNGIAREILEECGYQIELDKLHVAYVETEPEKCNNGNVTIRHTAYLGKITPEYVPKEGGEENEVDSVKWIPIDEIDNYKWAFNHREIILEYAPSLFKRKLLEIYHKIF